MILWSVFHNNSWRNHSSGFCAYKENPNIIIIAEFFLINWDFVAFERLCLTFRRNLNFNVRRLFACKIVSPWTKWLSINLPVLFFLFPPENLTDLTLLLSHNLIEGKLSLTTYFSLCSLVCLPFLFCSAMKTRKIAKRKTFILFEEKCFLNSQNEDNFSLIFSKKIRRILIEFQLRTWRFSCVLCCFKFVKNHFVCTLHFIPLNFSSGFVESFVENKLFFGFIYKIFDILLNISTVFDIFSLLKIFLILCDINFDLYSSYKIFLGSFHEFCTYRFTVIPFFLFFL